MARIVVRAPTPDDAAALAALTARAWQVGYRGLMPDDFLDQLDAVDRRPAWRSRLERHAGRHRERREADELLVAELVERGRRSDLVGVATIGPERGGDGTRGELWMINVDPGAWRRGVGSRLLAAATTRLGERGHDEAVVWVLEGNHRARRFYEGAGWRHDGGRKLASFGGRSVPEVRYTRQVVDRAA